MVSQLVNPSPETHYQHQHQMAIQGGSGFNNAGYDDNAGFANTGFGGQVSGDDWNTVNENAQW
jgi:hypothetical protein